jgi:thiamine-phosphate pyrophosphorylase
MGLPFSLLIICDGAPRRLEHLQAAFSGLRTEPRASAFCSRAEPRASTASEGAARVAVLLRDKAASPRRLLDQARALRALTHRCGARLLISDRLDVAQLSEADGVQLPEAGLSVHDARRLLGSAALIGVSRHSGAGVLAAQDDGADYATLSPVFASPEKGEPLGIPGFEQVARSSSLPVLALGGVSADQVPALIQAGAAGVAVIREVMSSSDPGAAAQKLLRALEISHLV